MTQLSPVKQITELYKRLGRAREIADDGRVYPVLGQEAVYVVQGNSGFYVVDGDGCTCPDAAFGAPLHHGYCKHRLAVCIYVESHAAPFTGPDGRDGDLEVKLAELF